MNELVADIYNALQNYFSEPLKDIDPCWEPCAWSQVYRLTLHNGTHFFLKGTPRSRNEAVVTQFLYSVCPSCIPNVLIADVLPASTWCWFLMEDAGSTDSSTLPLSVTCEAVNKLGTLQQHITNQSEILSSLLIQCEGDRLQQRVLEVCQWAIHYPHTEVQTELQQIIARLEEATPFFTELAAQLAELPSTVVHGDFWPGNIAVINNDVRLLDWGDTLWGVAGISVVNLLATTDGIHGREVEQVWEAYEQGWKRPISLIYRQACQTASIITDIMVDQAIATTTGQGPDCLRGLLPALRELENMIPAVYAEKR